MMYYVTAKDAETARKAVQRLQAQDLDNCYISPLTALCCLSDKSVAEEAKTALRLDMLTVCDVLIVASEVCESMRAEIRLAECVNMEVRYLEN